MRQQGLAIMSGFADVATTLAELATHGYLADKRTATAAYLADALQKPLLVEGPAGVGKTELAKAVATALGAELIRLQCYEGLDEARALYEWNYRKQLLRIQASRESSWEEAEVDIFGADFLLERPLLRALRRVDPTVLLIDEVDKADIEFEALLLELLSDFQTTIPELGTIQATRRPYVVLTSNATRELSEALKRRCLYLHLDYPDAAREREIVLVRVPEASAEFAAKVVRTVRALRGLGLRKPPSISETIDWTRTLLALGIDDVGGTALVDTLGVLLKNRADQDRAVDALALPEG
jgi:MoxR-like ATPase